MVVWVLVLSVIAALAPARADDAFDEDSHTDAAEACRHQPDAFYVPKDPQGNWFWWYCRSETSIYGNEYSPFGWSDSSDINADDDDNWEDWMAKHLVSGNLVDFSQLKEEPCVTWEVRNPETEGDLSDAQCAKIKTLGMRQSPCDQWWDLIKSVQYQRGVEPLDVERDGALISICRVHQAHFQRSWSQRPLVDTNEYDRYQFSAPPEISQPISQILSIAQWVALVAGVVGVLSCAAKLAVGYQNGFGETATGIVVVLGSICLAMSAMALASLVLIG
ncbi:hypothetical protein LO772_01400 [Yinghuangia sp. ASG 101]|uniref:hypothetical protein n=1 Tax=Yinghuangia sp. ASG 101 TaxID=2896848 RepID=UPI001E53F3BB|nr:hypothetical protein [Yinghuangia sp. ASG 101]UGQ12295.1 hypothetical protein LO772_01400 [Yinghuangia sp. ASG 101]